MKKIFLVSNFFVLLLFSGSLAQQNNSLPPKQIAFYNKYAFSDEKNGIKKLSRAINSVYACTYGELTEEQRKSSAESYKKRYKIIVEPVENEISQLIAQIGFQNSTLIMEVNDSRIIALDENLDITQTLIAVLNEHFNTKTKPDLSLNLPAGKIGKINTDLFLDENWGIKKFIARFKEAGLFIKNETGKNPAFDEIKARLINEKPETNIFYQIGNLMQSYAKEIGFSVVFDSSKSLPAELENFQNHDITKDFISYYNQLNP